ncbi:hypothetical protein ACE1TH_09940 [Shouchella sp. JSM 1781072]|uniref:hypothetical protein n=1 Tax=Bacillaceae TaxID=186817 RepID=UPI000C085229|nr:hypothetical protein [Bacillus sp. Marseille-P3800]
MKEYFINDKTVFEKQKKRITTFLDVREEFPNQILKLETSLYLFNEFEWVLSEDGWNSIKRLSEVSRDNTIYISMVDDWDYVDETFEKYGFYFMAKLPTSISGVKFEEILIEDIGKTNDSLMIVVNKAVIYPESLEWVIYVEREHELGVLAINNHHLKEKHGKDWLPLGEEIFDLISVVFRNQTVPPCFRSTLEKNYR